MYHNIEILQEQLQRFDIKVDIDLSNTIIISDKEDNFLEYDELPEQVQSILDNWAADNNVS